MSALIKKRYLIIFKDGSIRPTDKLTQDDFNQTRKGNITIIDIKTKHVTEGNTSLLCWNVTRVKDAIESKPLSKRNLD